MRLRLSLPLVLLVSGLAAACDPVGAVVGAGATVGVAAADERGIGGVAADTKIRAQINETWFRHDEKMFQDVDLAVNEGRVMLTGKVSKPEERVEAVRLTWQVAGVRQVIDEIQVTDNSSFMDYARDVRIANTLKGQLLFDKNVASINYTIDVVNGVVYLMGIAQSQDELNRVIAHARDIDGVKRVVNHVVLKSDASRLGP